MATIFNVPTRNEVSENNQQIFDKLEKGIGFVPNLYATFALSDTALGDYLQLQNRKSSLKAKEKEIINLVVSQFNECDYCLAAHTAIGKMNGFSDEEILEIRTGNASFNPSYDALAKFVRTIVEQKGQQSEAATSALLEAGYTKEQFVDIIVVIGDKIISNYFNNATQIPIDFPAAPALDTVLI